MTHCYTLHGKNIILDVNSGSIHVVDPSVLHAVQHWDSVNQTQFPDIQALIDAGKLFSQEIIISPPLSLRDISPKGGDPGDSRKVDGNAKASPAGGGAPQERRGMFVKAMCLHMAHACNLACEYCFVRAWDKQLMSYDVGKAAIDFLLANSGPRRNLDIDFFGGEPLLNWDVLKRLVAYARGKEAESGKHFRFTLTTNGVLIDDDVIDFCQREISNVVLSLDGRKETHDRLRKTHDGRGCYDDVVPKFRRLVGAREGCGYYIRGTFTHHNTDFLQDIAHMVALGFRALSLEPVVCSPAAPHALTPDDLRRVLDEYEALALDMVDGDYSFYHYTLNLRHGPCYYKRTAGCGVGTEYLAVTPDGEFYPCHQFVGNRAFIMGNVREGITSPALRDDFAGCSLHAKAECRDCWAKYFCAGGCPANAYHASGSIHGMYEDGCVLFKKRLECAIWLAASCVE
ncbi:MAG: thioether cross-link-forming SCIFF peptide maturase [Oscillospiraceae bacterium]|nr:thioether cross-link-forming SCIFF peptide maturase [Oscillospiraceae bacterium]